MFTRSQTALLLVRVAALFDVAHVVATRAKQGRCVNCGGLGRLSVDVPFCEPCARRAADSAVDVLLNGVARRR